MPKYTELYDQAFVDSLPIFGTFGNPMVVAVCKWPGQEKDYLKDRIEKWFQNLPEEEKIQMYPRLRSLTDHEFFSSYWELVFNQFGLEEGWDIKKNPGVPGGKTPDFWMKAGETDFYLEILSIGLSEEEKKQDRNRQAVIKAVEQIGAGHSISLNFHKHCDDQVLIRAFKKRVGDWLASLEEEKVGEELELNEFGVHLGIKSVALVKTVAGTCIRSVAGPGGMISKELSERMKERMAEKNQRYKFVIEKKKPFVLAMSVDEHHWPDEQLTWAMFGNELITINMNDPEAEAVLVRDNSGFVTPNPKSKGKLIENTRLSAVILCQERWYEGKMTYRLRVHHNPFATQKLPVEVFQKLPQLVPVEDGKAEWQKNDNTIIFAL